MLLEQRASLARGVVELKAATEICHRKEKGDRRGYEGKTENIE
jgi:hypothetical protein